MRDREKEGWKDIGRERGKDGEREARGGGGGGGVKERERERRAATMQNVTNFTHLLGRVSERERRESERAATMSQTSHISLPYTGTMILPFGMTLP